jgi:hypothetical protein
VRAQFGLTGAISRDIIVAVPDVLIRDVPAEDLARIDAHAARWSGSARAWTPERGAERIERGLVRIATVTLLEVGYAARSAAEVRAGLNEPPIASMPVEYATPIAEDRADRSTPRQLIESRSADLVERERRTANTPALEPPDRRLEADQGRVIVDLDHGGVQAGQIARADAVVDADAVTDAERRQPVAGIDRVQQVATRVDRRRQGAEVVVELAAGDRGQQRALVL